MDLDEIPVSLGIRDDEVGLASSSRIVHDIIKKEMADNGTPSTDIVIGGFSQGAISYA
jgi:predicted esterase